MLDINIISGFLRIVDHDSNIVYCVFDLTKFENKRIYNALNLIENNVERVTLVTSPINKTTQLFVGNQIIIQKTIGISNEIIDLYV